MSSRIAAPFTLQKSGEETQWLQPRNAYARSYKVLFQPQPNLDAVTKQPYQTFLLLDLTLE